MHLASFLLRSLFPSVARMEPNKSICSLSVPSSVTERTKVISVWPCLLRNNSFKKGVVVFFCHFGEVLGATMIFAILLATSLLARLVLGLCPPGTLTGLTSTDCCTFNGAEGWMEAQATCKQQGGNLASVHSAFENSFVFNGLGWANVYRNLGMSVFLGASKNIFSADWAWIDGTTFTYAAWLPSK